MSDECRRYLGNDGKYPHPTSFWCDQPEGHTTHHLDSTSGVGYENTENGDNDV